MTWPVASGAPSETPPLEVQLKAAFVYNFSKFVAWPAGSFASPESPMTICVTSESPLAAAIEGAVQGKLVDRRPFHVEHVGDEEDLGLCHILVIERSERRRVARLLEKVRSRAVLTVGENEEFPELGGIIGFFREKNRIRLRINVDAAKRSGLAVSSKLLSVGVIVHDPRKDE